ncbi:helix-turn-helix domain-containing protein [Umezawaea sp. Da 62-37]|uniref:PucR family transcriptional regulator n=1 Tax=Umezawaea sp. Da 62-37 TaxID=3075927 RepID=UPI0028F6F28C|nr:helix-turn-helix domain-containing protein [Umezawaea sp. Da 62-37]WNV85523.1 helix-turn-helix domain-containing protein [Umezawaea sp. Da 62-37]
MLHAQRAMFDSLLSHGIPGVLARLTEATGEPSAVVRLPDQVLASAPAGHHWALDRLRSGEGRVVPVDLPRLRCALLTTGDGDLAVDLGNHAAGLVKLELAKQQAVRAGRRELVGQVIEDVVRSAITTREAASRLRAAGIDPAEAHSVLVFAGGAPTADPGVATAVATVGRYEAVVLHEEQPALEVARTLAEHNPHITSIGVGGPYRGVHGLRWAFIEAQEAAGRGPGVHEGRVINMPTLLMSNPDLPVREVAAKVLQPLTAFDAERGGELVRTLELFLGSGGSPQLTAKELFVHRNTVRYRLEQIERLTGLSLSSVEARVHLWLAMRAVTPFGDAG